MIKNILWDFDGVILDSMKIKGRGFIELFKDYDSKKVKLLEEYHYKNGGISRFAKIKYFYETILEEEISDYKVEELANDFGKIIEIKLYDETNLISDSLSFIEQNYKNFNFHIVSGAEHNELNDLCGFFNIDKYFKSINGSPTKKNILVKNVLAKNDYRINETILIGDSINDYSAARDNEVAFYGYNNIDLKKYNYIDSLSNLSFN